MSFALEAWYVCILPFLFPMNSCEEALLSIDVKTRHDRTCWRMFLVIIICCYCLTRNLFQIITNLYYDSVWYVYQMKRFTFNGRLRFYVRNLSFNGFVWVEYSLKTNTWIWSLFMSPNRLVCVIVRNHVSTLTCDHVFLIYSAFVVFFLFIWRFSGATELWQRDIISL